MSNWILFFCLLATAMGQSVAIALMPALGRASCLSELQVASILSFSSIAFALGSIFWGKLSKKWSRRSTLIVGLSGYSIGTFVFASVFYVGLTTQIESGLLFLLLLISRILQSCLMSATPPSALAYAISTCSTDKLLPTISRLTSANSLGQMLGPMLVGFLVIFGLLVPLYTIIIFTLLALFLAWKILPIDKPSLVTSMPLSNAQVESRKSSEEYNYIPFAAIVASLFCSMAMTQQSLVFFIMDELKQNTINAASMVGIGAMITAGCSLITQLFLLQHLKMHQLSILKLGLFFLALGHLTIATNHDVNQIYVGMALLGFGLGLTYPTATSIATGQCNKSKQQAALGLISASPAIGFVVGPVIAALLYQQGVYLPFYASTILILTTIMLSATINKKDTQFRNTK